MTARKSDSRDRILDVAEAMIRTQGFNGFSFREIAKQVGVKSSSVHYYYPTKGDLGAAVTRRYTDRFLDSLGDPVDAPEDANAVIETMRDLFRKTLVEDRRMCLCGMLGAEISDLPEEVAGETAQFFTRSVDWLVASLTGTKWGKKAKPQKVRQVALKTIATLEGALIMARTLDDLSIFKKIELDHLEA